MLLWVMFWLGGCETLELADREIEMGFERLAHRVENIQRTADRRVERWWHQQARPALPSALPRGTRAP